MNTELEARIRASGQRLAAAIATGAPDARQLQADHLALLRERTPADHAEMARRKGLPCLTNEVA